MNNDGKDSYVKFSRQDPINFPIFGKCHVKIKNPKLYSKIGALGD